MALFLIIPMSNATDSHEEVKVLITPETSDKIQQKMSMGLQPTFEVNWATCEILRFSSSTPPYVIFAPECL